MDQYPSTKRAGEPPGIGAPTSESDFIADLYAQHHQTLVRYALSLNLSDEDAAEAVQDVFAYATTKRGVLERQRNPAASLFRAVRNLALNQIRDERVLKREIELYAADERHSNRVARNEGEAGVFVHEIESWIRTLVDRLPTKQREVFQLVRFAGLSYAATAQLLGVRFWTVNTHLMRATRTLARELERLGLLDGAVRPLLRSTGTRRPHTKRRVPNRRLGRVI